MKEEGSTPQADRGRTADANPRQAESSSASFRRLRPGRACVACHARKVRCDAASLGVPCTNCKAFTTECRVPTKNAKRKARKNADHLIQDARRESISQSNLDSSQGGVQLGPMEDLALTTPGALCNRLTTFLVEPQIEPEPEESKCYAKLIRRQITQEPIKEAGRVVYLEESSYMSLLIGERDGTTGIVHYPMQESVKIGRSKLTKIDKVELCILRRRGALSLPPKTLSDDLIRTYFKWVAPIMPVINKTRFMQQYRDPNNPPSLLLMQAVFLASARTCTNPQLMDSSGSTIPAAIGFYKRAKALYEANYEEDRIAIVQALILMGWYWEETGKVSKNVFYWTGLAVTIAQGFGMHRNAKHSRLSDADKRLWKRIWWTLFTRDRSVAVGVGRPPHIHIEDSDVEMLTEDDFRDEDDDDDQPTAALPNQLQVQFFLQYVKLSEVMDLVLLQNYSLTSKARQRSALALTQCDMALADWLESCPQELRWEQSKHHFWSAFLFSVYHTTSCLLHRTHLPTTYSHQEVQHNTQLDYSWLVRRNPAFQAAHAITSVVETLSDYNELRFSPPFMVYSLSSALLIHVYQLHTALPDADRQTQNRIRICLDCLEKISKTWLVAKMMQNLYESLLTQKGLGDFLQDRSGKIHDRNEDMSDQRSHDTGQLKDRGMASESSEMFSNRRKSQDSPLTPALLAHLFAALNSATASNISGNDESLTVIPSSRNTPYSGKPSQLINLPDNDLCSLNLNIQSISPNPQPFTEEIRYQQFDVPAAINMQMPQTNDLHQNSPMDTGSEIMAFSHPLNQGLHLSREKDFIHNAANGSQYLSYEPEMLPSGGYAIPSKHHIPGVNYSSANTPMAGPPVPTESNVLEWIQYFGIGNYS